MSEILRASRLRSERLSRAGRDGRGARRDVGATLTELLIGIVLMGIIMTALTSAVIVITKQRANTNGRLNNARAEQNLNIWLPADLTSTETVSTAANASPCGASCPTTADTRGSNALMLTWKTLQTNGSVAQQVTVNVSYRYMKVGTEYRLVRVACTSVAGAAWTCSSTVVLRNMPAPPSGTFTPGVDKPSWVLDVQLPLDAAATDPNATPIDPGLNVKNASRIIVTVNGGGANADAGGASTMTFTAGGTARKTIDADSVEGAPSFGEARTRCGGNYGMIVDYSGSIGGDFGNVKNGMKKFIDAFAGTPTKIQATIFWGKAVTLGTSNTAASWFRWYDMLKPADVTALKAAVDGYGMGGGTNWEDGFFHMFKNHDGTWGAVQPDTVLFFTDGQPNTYRSGSGTKSDGAANNPPNFTGTGIKSEEMSWLRANYLADSIRPTTRIIGVGVGAVATASTSFRFGTSGPRTTIPYWKTIEKLVMGSGSAIQGQWDGTKYTNADVANMYLMPDYTKFAQALQGVALAECGGTLTIQTQNSGSTVADPFTYQNTKIKSASGADLPAPLTVITTTSTYPSGTFDFDVSNGQYVDVTIEPQITSVLAGYTPVGWSCTAGATARSVVAVPISGSVWSGIKVRVAANEAVSCVLDVAAV